MLKTEIKHGVQARVLILTALAASSALAVFIAPFTNWDDLTERSPDIIIARCTTTPNPIAAIDGMIWSDIEVTSVLKGDTKRGIARMVSQYRPRQGDNFLMSRPTRPTTYIEPTTLQRAIASFRLVAPRLQMS